MSPFFANKGYHPRASFTPNDNAPIFSPPARAFITDLSKLHEHLQIEMSKAQESAALQFDKHRAPLPKYTDIPKGSHVKSLPPRKKTSSVSTAVTYIKECACHSCYKFKQAIESLIKEKSNIDELCKAILSDLQVSMCMKPTVVMWAWFAHQLKRAMLECKLSKDRLGENRKKEDDGF
ncbi:hypothetical protein C368_06291 [Cryptococcus neoformans 125.91]|nr:hypothetical protein C368_06291 [Cryptococcus neoformans var. grubii 125.91]